MDALIQKRGLIKRKITSFLNFLDNKVINVYTDTTVALEDFVKLQIKERLKQARIDFESYYEVQDQLKH